MAFVLSFSLLIVRSAYDYSYFYYLWAFTVDDICAKMLLMWILISVIFGVPYTTVEYFVIVLLKSLLRVLVQVEVVFDKFFRWLRTTIPCRFIASILRAALTWYRKVWTIRKIVLWLLICLLVLPMRVVDFIIYIFIKLLFVPLHIAAHLIVWWGGFSIIFLILFFVIFVAFLRRTTIFLKKIIKKGEISFAKNYEEIATRNVNAFLQLRKTLISKVITLTKRLKLSNSLSSSIVRLYTEALDSLFFLVTKLYWFATFCVIAYCTVKISPLFILALVSVILFNWAVS